jgi:O-Antigen ligase
LTWDSRDDPPFYLSYHWLDSGADRVVAFDGVRTPFDAPVPPDASATIVARVRAPIQPGSYRLAWDIVQEGRLWFSTEPGGTLTFSQATVAGARAARPVTTTPLPRPAERPGRWTLWSAAGRMFAAHPLLGVGPDNFRLLYGAYAGLRNADSRTHSNNTYLEVLVGAGLLGGLACGWLVWRIAGTVAAGVRTAAADARMAPALGVAAAVVAIGLHGLVDSFVSFTPTYVLIAITLGLAQSGARSALTIGTNADRI